MIKRLDKNKKIEKLIQASRKNYAIVYKKLEIAKKINGQLVNAEEKVDANVSEGGVPNTPEFQEAA